MNVTHIPSLFEQLISETFNLTDYVSGLFSILHVHEIIDPLREQTG